MNVPEIYRRLEEVNNKLSHLQLLTLSKLDMVLRADRLGKLRSTVNPPKARPRTILTYENL